MSALAQLIVILTSCLGVVLATWWGVPGDPAQPTSDKPLLIADGRPFHRVPIRNLHRLHGRHRA